MLIELKHTMYPVKNGFAAHSPELGLTAHGYSPQVAKENLERIALLFLRPFERQGSLKEEIHILGLEVGADEGELAIRVTG